MTTKDCIILARVLRETDAFSTAHVRTIDAGREQLAEDLSRALVEDNPRFNKELFIREVLQRD
jgi:hypothetical protein